MIYISQVLSKIFYISTILSITFSTLFIGSILDIGLVPNFSAKSNQFKLLVAALIFLVLAIFVPQDLVNIVDLEIKARKLQNEIRLLEIEKDRMIGNYEI